MRSPLRRSFLRPQTWLEGERRVVGFVAMVGVIMGWTLSHSNGVMVAAGVAIVWWAGGLWAARELAKHDPFAIDVWLRTLRYRGFYRPSGNHNGETPQVRDWC